MKMSTNMSLYNGFSSIGITSGPPSAEASPLALLSKASASRILYSIMIVKNLFDRDVSKVEGATNVVAQLALAEAMEQQGPYNLEVREGVPGPTRGARESFSLDGHMCWLTACGCRGACISKNG